MPPQKSSNPESCQDRLEFDINASVRRLQESYLITPELKNSILDEELSYVEEAIDAPQRRSYYLDYTGEDLVDVEGRSLAEMMQNGIDWATTKLTKRKAIADHEEYRLLIKMMNGQLGCNTLVSFRPFPEEYSTKDNEHDLNKLGMQPKRRLGFMNVYRKDGNRVLVHCISLDNTKSENIRRIALQFDQPIPEAVLTDEFQAYPIRLTTLNSDSITDYFVKLNDDLLESQTGFKHHQGRIDNRPHGPLEIRQFLQKQPELIEFYWQELINLSNRQLNEAELTIAKKTITYSFWARIKERYNAPEKFNVNNREVTYFNLNDPQIYQNLAYEVMSAGSRAAARLEVLIGCGGAMSLSELTNLDPSTAAGFILGEKPNDESDNIPALLRCINPDCRKVSKKEEVIKKDCWVCPKCGVKAICGTVIYPDKNK